MDILDALLLLSLLSKYSDPPPTGSAAPETKQPDSSPTTADLMAQYVDFKKTYNRIYADPSEEKMRTRIYMENAVKIAKNNRLYALGKRSFLMGMNQYGDMLHSEYMQYTGMEGNRQQRLLRMKSKTDNATTTTPQTWADDNDPTYAHYLGSANVELPAQVDWRCLNAVTPVKDQGACGSCWAFATIGVLETALWRQTGRLVALSEQNLVDCSGGYGNHGCTSGWPADAMRYVRDNRGIDTAASYPYEARAGVCRFRKETVATWSVAIVQLPGGDERMLCDAVATQGPVSVVFDASPSSFQLYKGGIYYDKKCSTNSPDHAVLVVGYGTDEKGQDYWLVKNSWGPLWGENGYFRLARNKNNHCGIASKGSYAMR